MSKTSIEWTNETWNPVRGCTKISPGCKHCYAETFAERWRGIPGHPYQQGFDLRLVPEKLAEPLRWKKPRRVFVNSMSDLFHGQVPFEYIAAVFGIMAATTRHTYQVLTKRPGQMRTFFAWVKHEQRHRRDFTLDAWKVVEEDAAELVPYLPAAATGREWPLSNVWLGVSVEDRKSGLPRIDELRATPAAVRFLSVEPLLEDLGHLDLSGIDWVIVGGESGHGARPMHPEWVRNIRDQVLALREPCPVCAGRGRLPGSPIPPDMTLAACAECESTGFHGPALFFKQWGAYCTPNQMPRETFLEWSRRDMETTEHPRQHPGRVGPVRVGKAKAGRELDGRTWDEMPRRLP